MTPIAVRSLWIGVLRRREEKLYGSVIICHGDDDVDAAATDDDDDYDHDNIVTLAITIIMHIIVIAKRCHIL